MLMDLFRSKRPHQKPHFCFNEFMSIPLCFRVLGLKFFIAGKLICPIKLHKSVSETWNMKQTFIDQPRFN